MQTEPTRITPLPGLEPPTMPTGQLEAQVRAQIEALQSLGYVEAHHAGLCALAIVTARDLDTTTGHGKPYARANLLRVMNEILMSLPQPETASRDKLDDVIDAIRYGKDLSDVLP